MNDNKIDFVITWVDGNDPKWQAEKSDYLKREDPTAWGNWVAGDMRYRDWGLLKYWFRGVEECAPWVNKIHFVTWGHYPDWLNVEHEKLKIVNHRDFIPEKYLPTFNSNAIELNLHRIKDLSEQFVYFNDDMFLLKKRKPEDFFKNGLPRDFAGLDLGFFTRYNLNYRLLNSMVINDHFDKRDVIRKDPFKWINIKYGIQSNLRTLLLLPYAEFSALQREHLCMNMLKSTFENLWEIEQKELDLSCSHHFREFREVNPWLILDWQRASGNFIPRKPILDSVFECGPDTDEKRIRKIVRKIENTDRAVICLNDYCKDERSSEKWANAIIAAFKKRYPHKCTYER